MAAANLVVKLLLENDGFDKNIKSAKASIEGFEKVGKNVLGTLTKVGSALGIATTAVEAFQQIVKASQTTSDAWDATIRTCKNSVDGFFTAIATGDFSYMERGFEMIKQKAKEAAAAIDQLGNSTMSYNYFTSKNDAAFQTALQKAKDKTLSQSDRETAKKTAIAIIGEQEEISKVMGDTLDEVLRKTVTEKNSLSWLNVSKADIEDILRIDVMSNRNSEKERLTKEYEEYKRIREEAKEWVKENQRGKYTTIWGFNKLVDTRMESMGVTKEKYKDAILYQEMLVKNGDDWLQNLINIANQYDNVIRKMATMKQAMNEVNSMNLSQGITTTSSKSTKADPAVENSFRWIDEEIAKIKKEMANINIELNPDKYQELKKKLDELEARKLKLEYELTPHEKHGPVLTGYLANLKIPSTTRKVEATTKTTLENKEAVDELTASLDIYQMSVGNVSSILSSLSTAMSENGNAWLNWGSNLLATLATAIPTIVTVVAGNSAMDESLRKITEATSEYGIEQSKTAVATYAVAEANLAEAASLKVLAEAKEKYGETTSKNTSSLENEIGTIREIIVAKQAEAAANAGAEAAKTPGFGWLTAAAAIASVIAAFAAIPKFANGGIINSPFTSGDRVLARVNGGEMILNKHQQSTLFNLLDNGIMGGLNQVQFKISGKELVGVLENYNNRMSKLR